MKKDLKIHHLSGIATLTLTGVDSLLRTSEHATQRPFEAMFTGFNANIFQPVSAKAYNKAEAHNNDKPSTINSKTLIVRFDFTQHLDTPHFKTLKEMTGKDITFVKGKPIMPKNLILEEQFLCVLADIGYATFGTTRLQFNISLNNGQTITR